MRKTLFSAETGGKMAEIELLSYGGSTTTPWTALAETVESLRCGKRHIGAPCALNGDSRSGRVKDCSVTRGPCRGLLDAAEQLVPVRLLVADAESDSKANHQPIRQRWGAHGVIPANPRRGVPNGAIHYQMYRTFRGTLWATCEVRNELLGGQTLLARSRT